MLHKTFPGVIPGGQAYRPKLREGPELKAWEPNPDDQTARWMQWITAAMAATVVLVAVMVWLNLTGRMK